jgi:hypothetical protein
MYPVLNVDLAKWSKAVAECHADAKVKRKYSFYLFLPRPGSELWVTHRPTFTPGKDSCYPLDSKEVMQSLYTPWRRLGGEEI